METAVLLFFAIKYNKNLNLCINLDGWEILLIIHQ